MSRIIFLLVIVGLAVVVVAAININVVDARQQTEFVQVSVLAEHQADYGVNEQVIVIPAVSVDIIEDAAQDFQAQSSVRVITYTSLPTKEPRPDREEQQGPESLDEIKQDNGHENGNNQGNAVETGNNVNQGNNGDGGSNPNNGNGNGNGSEEEKNKDKGNGNGNGNGNGGDGGNDNKKSDENKSEKKE